MNIVLKQMISGISFSIVSLILFSISFFIAFPLENWSELLNRQLLDIPVSLFIPSLSVALGIIFGFALGMYWRKQLGIIENLLQKVQEGRALDDHLAGDIEIITKRILHIQNRINDQTKLAQKIVNEKAEDQEKRIQAIISEERNRLARELHDSVSQQLFAASMMMSAINESSQSNKRLKLVEEMIHQSQLEMRALLLHLRPVALKGKSLQVGIEELLLELSQKVTMDIQWKLEDFSLDKGVEDHFFRILQESVSNTLRHAKAVKLEVLLIKRDGFAILRVIDDGVGFDVEVEKAGSYGLQNMKERAIEIGGTCKIISIKNKGTRLEVKIPVIEREEEND